jgi:hypothetical protein
MHGTPVEDGCASMEVQKVLLIDLHIFIGDVIIIIPK